MFLLIVIPATGYTLESTDDASQAPADSETGCALNDVEREESILAEINAAWERYVSDTNSGRNWRKLMADSFRTQPINQALIAYWYIYDEFPDAVTPEQSIDLLVSSNLLPFWGCDPETSEPVKLVFNTADVSTYTDLYVSFGLDRAFDYVLTRYDGSSPEFTEYVEFFNSSGRLSELSRIIHVPPELEHEVRDTEPLQLPDDPAEVFATMIGTLFRQMVQESFKVRGGNLPTNLQELLAGRMVVNEEGWGTPAGALGTGKIGSFEYGVDPLTNSYYMEWISAENGRVFIANRFVESELAGESVYDLTSSVAMLEGSGENYLQSRVPILTDELFANPPPEL